MIKYILIISAFIAILPRAMGQEDLNQQPPATAAAPNTQPAAPKAPVPAYVSLEPDLNQYYLYADGGWDGHWYVGYNSCWIVKLPAAPQGNFSKAFIGAKLGRAKTTASAGKPWEKKPNPGKIYMSLSPVPSFASEQSYFLIDGSDIPIEPAANDNMKGVGPSEWFWAKVPLDKVASDKPNFLSIWSSSEYFVSSDSSPIIAGAESQARQEAVWLNRSIRGVPPREAEGALETPVYHLQPAMAIKLIPRNEYKVLIRGFSATLNPKNITASFSAIGQDIRAGWIELSHDKFDWQRISRMVTRPPYSFTFDRSELPANDIYYLRAVAVDSLENTGYSREITVPVSITQ